MSKFWDRWATTHRNWEAIFSAVGVLLILAWAVVQLWSAEIVRITFETAVVREVKSFTTAGADAGRGDGGGMSVQVGRLELNDGRTIEILLVPPIPRTGDRVPLKVEHYDDGSRSYSIDRTRWQTRRSE